MIVRDANILNSLQSGTTWIQTTQWNVTTHICNFGGRIDFYRFLYSPAVARSPPPSFLLLFFLFNSGDMHSCRPEAKPRARKYVY